MAEKKPSGWAAYNARQKAEREAALAAAQEESEKAMRRTAKKTVKRKAKKAMRKCHPATIVLAILFLCLGAVGGYLICRQCSLDDRFVLNGQRNITLTVKEEGTVYVFQDPGAYVAAFGRDVSDTVKAETTLEKDAAGNFLVPCDKPGVYTIVYSSDALPYRGILGREQILRVRVITVTEN